MVTISWRRRNVLLLCGAGAFGGYVAYRVYTSRTRLRVLLFLESFSTLLEALAAGSDSCGVLLSDLRGFLVSGEDEVPQSLKQLLKLSRTPEAQESVSALTAAVCRGIFSALASGGSVAPSLTVQKEQFFQSRVSSPNGAGNLVETKNSVFENYDVHAFDSLEDRALAPDDDGDEKLISESWQCKFASTVVASASRGFATSVVEHMNSLNGSSLGSETGSNGLGKALVSFARSADGKAMLADWIQTFVGTAVSVYLDRTKDINTFDELAACLANPEHRIVITGLLSTLCEASTSTFVRTSHEVLTSSGPSSSSKGMMVSSPDLPGELVHDSEGLEMFYDTGEFQESMSPTQSPVHRKGKTIAFGKSEPAPTNYIEQISKVLAVPSNRKLILEIAGTVSSSAVRSTIDVSLGKVSAALGMKGKEPVVKDQVHSAPRSGYFGEKLQAVGDATKGAMDKSVVLMTMCFAVCLHSVFGGVRMLQPF